jgi:hypothetical protein
VVHQKYTGYRLASTHPKSFKVGDDHSKFTGWFMHGFIKQLLTGRPHIVDMFLSVDFSRLIVEFIANTCNSHKSIHRVRTGRLAFRPRPML